ncbi:MAG: hypothetical protein F6K32_01640 [Desertifilum sp. SIO1I2]|nr:hypothetical protein [Desertifilum sp. SIO1I2]
MSLHRRISLAAMALATCGFLSLSATSAKALTLHFQSLDGIATGTISMDSGHISDIIHQPLEYKLYPTKILLSYGTPGPAYQATDYILSRTPGSWEWIQPFPSPWYGGPNSHPLAVVSSTTYFKMKIFCPFASLGDCVNAPATISLWSYYLDHTWYEGTGFIARIDRPSVQPTPVSNIPEPTTGLTLLLFGSAVGLAQWNKQRCSRPLPLNK